VIRKRRNGLQVQVYAGRDPLTGGKRWVSRQVPGQTKRSYRVRALASSRPTRSMYTTGPRSPSA